MHVCCVIVKAFDPSLWDAAKNFKYNIFVKPQVLIKE